MNFIVWMHHGGDVKAVASFDHRDMADKYAAYCNRSNPVRWFEVRRGASAVQGNDAIHRNQARYVRHHLRGDRWEVSRSHVDVGGI